MIYTFGDSFGESEGSELEPTWVGYLQKLVSREKVNNQCKGGLGPIDHFKSFWKLKDEIVSDKDNKIVFLLSNPFRLSFDYLKNPGHAKELGDYMVSICEKRSQTYPFVEVLGDRESELKTFYNFYADELYHINYKNVMTLKCLSELYQIKTMVFLSFTIGTKEEPMADRLESWEPDPFFKSLEKLNDYYFRFYSTPLRTYAGDYASVDEPVKKDLYNHLTTEDHKIVYNIIKNHFFKDLLNIENEEFQERKPETGKFIYE